MPTRALCLILSGLLASTLTAEERPSIGALKAYTQENVPDNVIDLWKDYDPREYPMGTQIVEEWIEDGVVCHYVIFELGNFKGRSARIAAFYTFPEGMEKGPAFVWSHGGGQRADRERGIYFAKQGYATLDINWGGREMIDGIEKNTDWGLVDPSQGPRFYPKALRPGTKINLLPDEHTIDPVVSPRNGNWFLLALAGRRAITFLERQPEVDPERIGFTGYSMGGNITSYVAIDKRLKAVVPMVGGAGFITADFPGLPGTGRGGLHDHAELFSRTMESQSYYPHVTCPVLLLSATNDFHSTFEHIYNCMDVLPHDNWRVSQKMHFSHSLGPEQWILLNQWFDEYLKGEPQDIPATPASNLKVSEKDGSARFTASPDRSDELRALDVYYSHDPNPRSRFWIKANATRTADTWASELPVRKNLPLFVFANCTYTLPEPRESFGGTAHALTITSREQTYYPTVIQPELLHADARENPLFEDFKANGFRNWAFGPRGGLSTYKFRDPRMKTPTADQSLRIALNVPRESLSFRFRISKNKYLTGVKVPQRSFSVSHHFKKSGDQELILQPSDFKENRKEPMENWENITTFVLEVYDGAGKQSLDFSKPENRGIFAKLEWVGAEPQ